MIAALKQKSSSTILGLAFDGNQVSGIVLRRTNGSAEIRQSFTATLALNPLNADPQLLGRELRNHLDKAEIRERRCIVSLPAQWAMMLQTKLMAELPASDVASFLQIEAERGFHAAPETFSIAESRFQAGNNENFASLIAISRHHLTQLEEALRAARLTPVSFTLASAALQDPADKSSDGALFLLVGEHAIDLQVTCNSGVAALRTLDNSVETEGAQKKIDADFVAREIRITLGQLPGAVRDSLKTIKLIGPTSLVQRLAGDLSGKVRSLNLSVEVIERISKEKLEGQIPPAFVASPALAAARKILFEGKATLEFLPPYITQWQQLRARISSKKLGWVGATAGALALLVVLAFLVQQIQLTYYQTKWSNMEANVKELDNAQQNIRKYRPWFDNSFRSLAMLKKLTEAFPEDGQVSAKTVEFRDPTTVTCSGIARDNSSFLKMLDKLRALKEVSDLKIEHVRGQAPLQFTFNFQWEGGNGN